MRCSGATAMMLHLLVVVAVFKYVSSQVTSPPGNCGGVTCGTNAICSVQNDVSVCTCPSGTVGNPLQMCVSCLSDFDCAENQACRNNTCVNPCDNVQCPFLRHCVPANHQGICAFRIPIPI